jgi:hypothetical protein
MTTYVPWFNLISTCPDRYFYSFNRFSMQICRFGNGSNRRVDVLRRHARLFNCMEWVLLPAAPMPYSCLLVLVCLFSFSRFSLVANFSSGSSDSASREWYSSSTDRPIKRLQSSLRKHFPNWNVSLPTDTKCTLTATKNIVGRFLNGVPAGDVCSTAAKAEDAQGYFIHAEQAAVSRKSSEGWLAAVEEAFQPVA